MAIFNMLYSDRIDIIDKVSVAIPTVGEILDNENEYYTYLSMLTAMPIDYMVMLDELGLDFSKVSEYELFLILFPYIQDEYVKGTVGSRLLFRDLDISKFRIAQCEDTESFALVDTTNDIIIDRTVQAKIASAFRKIHGIKKDIRKPANVEARDYMLEVARRKIKRSKMTKEQSQLEMSIVALVNSSEFKYDFKTVRDLTIYQFNESLRQVIKRVDYDKYMYGVYSGTISTKDMSKDDLNWLCH